MTAPREKWLRFFNTVLYERLAPLYAAIDWMTFGIWWRLVRRALPYVPRDTSVLEIGFGPGKLLTELGRQSPLCVGVDLAWGMCRITKNRLLKQGVSAYVIRGDSFVLPFTNGAFDAVVSTFAFSGLPDSQAALREMVRVTASGGRVVLVDIGLPTDNNQIGRFLAHLWERMGDFLHDQPRMMDRAGLQVIEFTEFGPGRHIRVVVGEKP